MTATFQTRTRSGSARITVSRPTRMGEVTTLPRMVATVVLGVLAPSTRFRTSGSRQSRKRQLGRARTWARGPQPGREPRRSQGQQPGRGLPWRRAWRLGRGTARGRGTMWGRAWPTGPTGGPEPLRGARARIPRPGRAAAQRREMEEGVPEVIDVLRATVAAGINPRRALQAAAEGAPTALEAVLGQATRAAELGVGAGRALATAAETQHLSELALAGEALDLAETTGAPPGPVLAGVAAAAADRVRSRQAMMAATAQARLSARVVAAMAPAFLCVLALTAPSDAAFLIREPVGWATLAAAMTFELLGIWWATHIVRGPTP
jgi:hypothetical protein